jgi:hypothetical protein
LTDFISIEFEHSLENEILNHSYQLAMRKIAIMTNKTPNSPPSPLNKQQNLESYSAHNTYNENKSPLSATKKFFWNKSNSKDG